MMKCHNKSVLPVLSPLRPMPLARRAKPFSHAIPVCILLFAFAALLVAPLACAQHQDHSVPKTHASHEGVSMPAEPRHPGEAAYQAELLAEKRESELDHHVAGILVILAGVFILAERFLCRRWPFVRFIWPMCFVSAGLFLLVYSDTELWPFGRVSWWSGLSQRPEDLQHKIFAMILLGVGFIEIQRARDALKAAWGAWVFPTLAVLGSVMLLFHEHDPRTPIAVMRHIQSQHLSFALTGFGIALTKGLSEVRMGWQSVFARLSPTLVIALGVLLMLYTE